MTDLTTLLEVGGPLAALGGGAAYARAKHPAVYWSAVGLPVSTVRLLGSYGSVMEACGLTVAPSRLRVLAVKATTRREVRPVPPRRGIIRPTSTGLRLRLRLAPGQEPADVAASAERLRNAWGVHAVYVRTVKAYRLLKAVMETAVDDELIRRNPCRIRGAGKEAATERQIATVDQVDALADAVGPRWRLMVFLGAYGPMRPEEQAELRRKDVDLDAMTIRVRRAAPELTTGKRAEGPTKSEAGKRIVVLPAFLRTDLRRHLDWYAEKGPDGLLFVGEKGKPFRRSSFGRKWRRARAAAGLPENFRFYDLRHTGHTLATRSGATLKDTMVRAGQSSEKAALIYQHSDLTRQQEVASGLDQLVRAARRKGTDPSSGADLVRDA
ncbi:tyrosine-type recombinase/integrase [Streptomyces sp. Act-28]